MDTARQIGWWYHPDLDTKKRWFGHLGGFDSEIGWQQYLDIMNENVQKVEQAAVDERTPITEIFEPEQSDKQIVPIINALVNDVEGVFQVNIPNRGSILPGFPEDLVIECQGVVDASGIHGVTVPPLPHKLMISAMLPRWQRAELVVEAVRKTDYDLLLLALLYDPRTHSPKQAEILLSEWLSDPRNKRLAELFKVR